MDITVFLNIVCRSRQLALTFNTQKPRNITTGTSTAAVVIHTATACASIARQTMEAKKQAMPTMAQSPATAPTVNQIDVRFPRISAVGKKLSWIEFKVLPPFFCYLLGIGVSG